jgi:subtilisin family serine protease
MKCLILKRRQDVEENPFVENASARFNKDVELPFVAESEDLTDDDIADVHRDPLTVDVIPSISFTLVEPFYESEFLPGLSEAWGVEAVLAHESPQGGFGVTVAVIDTGIDQSHPAFSGLVFGEQNLMDFTGVESGVPGSAPDIHGHGTHVAGTIFGRDVAGTRIGIAPGVDRVLIGKVLGPNGGGTEAVLNAIEWVIKQRADIICMSLGIDFPGLATRLSREGFPEQIAVSRALQAYRSNIRLFDRLGSFIQARGDSGRGGLLVAASGNESCRKKDRRFTVTCAPPAAAEGFISVGALSDGPLAVAHFSNTGCLFSAPGVKILSARAGGGLGIMSGTSMAAPHVAGVAALWTEKLFKDGCRPSGWATHVQRELERHSKPIVGQLRNDVGLGIPQAPNS